MLQEVEKRRNLYIAALPRDRRNAGQHASEARHSSLPCTVLSQVILTAKVHTHYERFLQNFTTHATEEQHIMLEGVFQRFAGGHVAYYGRQGIWEDTPYTLAEKLDIMLEAVEKRRNLYIATLPEHRRIAAQHGNPEDLSADDLSHMMTAWENDHEMRAPRCAPR